MKLQKELLRVALLKTPLNIIKLKVMESFNQEDKNEIENEIDKMVSGIRNEPTNLNRWVDKQELKLYFDTCDTYLKMHRDNGTFKKEMIKTNLNSKNAKVYYHLGKCLKVLNNLKNK